METAAQAPPMTEEELKKEEGRKTERTEREEIAPEELNNSRLGTLVFLSAEAMFFAGFLGAFVVLRSGAEVAPPVDEAGYGGWISLGTGIVALLALEFARRNAAREKGDFSAEMRFLRSPFFFAGVLLPVLAAAVWLVAESDAILEWGGGSFSDPAAVSPIRGCWLFLHTFLALHVLITLLLTGVGVRRSVRSSDAAAEFLVRGELLWGFVLAARLAFIGIGV